MNNTFICISLDKVVGADNHFALGLHWLSCSGAAVIKEDEQGVILLYGYVHNADFNCAASYWLELYQQSQEQFVSAINQLDGAYSIFLLNKHDSSCLLITDRFGCQRLYHYQHHDAIWLRPDLKQLAANINNKQFDDLGLMETLHFRWLTGNHSLINGVKKLPHAAVVLLSAQQEPVILRRFGTLSPKCPGPELTLEQHADKVHALLRTNIANSVKPTDRVAVLLSGGVDSSILLGICCELKLQVVAFTPEHEHHANPELDTARQFAAELGVEHRVLPVTDDALAQLFNDTVQLLDAAPRSHSAVSLMYVMSKMAGEFDKVLYGEGADTLFGSRGVKHFAMRYAKHLKLKNVMKYLPASNAMLRLLPAGSKLKMLSEFNVRQAALAQVQLAINPQTEHGLTAPLQLQYDVISQQLNVDVQVIDSIESAVRYVKQVLFSTDVVNHFYEVCSLASKYQLQLVNPFVSWPVMQYAAQLPEQFYFGQQYVKPVLRKIGESFFTPGLMYLPKFGFPVPHKHWLASSLKPLTIQASQFFQVPSSWAKDTETAWTLAGLYVVASTLEAEPYHMTIGK